VTEHPEIHHRIDSLESTLVAALTKLTRAVEASITLETQHHATVETLARYGAKLDKHDARLDVIEKEAPRMVRFLDRWDKVSLSLVIGIVHCCYIRGDIWLNLVNSP